MFIKPYPPFESPTGDGHNMAWNDPVKRLVYAALNGKMYRNVIGATSDGASTPKAIWNIYPPFGLYWLPCVLHDFAYRSMLEVSEDFGKTWRRVIPEKDYDDSLLLEAMQSQGVDDVTARIIYEAVKNFAYGAYGDDAAEPIKLES